MISDRQMPETRSEDETQLQFAEMLQTMEKDELLQDVCEAASLGDDFTSSIERTR